MPPRTLPASALILSPLKTAGLLLGSIAVAIVLAGCSPAEPEKIEAEKQASSAAVVSSESQKAAVDSIAPTPAPAEAVPAPKTAMSSKETYIQIMKEYSNIKTIADVEAIILKYGSKKLIAGFEAGETEMNAASASERDKVFSEFKSKAVLSREIITIQESIDGSTATVSSSTKSGQKFITILVLENNQWKIDSVGF